VLGVVVLWGLWATVNTVRGWAEDDEPSAATTPCPVGAPDGETPTGCPPADLLAALDAAWSVRLPEYRSARVAVHTGRPGGPCGTGDLELGYHYCPLEDTVFLDERFAGHLERREREHGGTRALDYLAARELGHHVHHLRRPDGSGTGSGPRAAGAGGSGTDDRTRLELAADCHAGIALGDLADAGHREPLTDEEARLAVEAVDAVDHRFAQRDPSRDTGSTAVRVDPEVRLRWLLTGHRQRTPAACDAVRDALLEPATTTDETILPPPATLDLPPR
jgi:predicted metalloprotease